MNPLQLRAIGKTESKVTALGMGSGTLGDLREETSEAQADQTAAAAWDAGLRYFDTAPFYGHGKAEHRVGRLLRTKPRDEFVLSTKVGRVYSRPEPLDRYKSHGWKAGLPFNFRSDYTRGGVLRSYEDSLMRLGLNRVDALLIHDLDPGMLGGEEAVRASLHQLEDSGYGALRALRDRGEVRAIGAGINCCGMIPRFLERFELDLFLIAMPYTLLSQEALEVELPLCQERGVGVVIGAPFASGILSRGPESGTYAYGTPASEVVNKTLRIRTVCERYGVPLGAAALQFPLAHPSVASVIPGPNSPEQARCNVEWMRTEIPAAFWAELRTEGLLHPDAPIPT